MDLSVLLPARGPIADLVTIARRAEAKGLVGVYCMEGPRSGVVPVAAVATATQRVRVGPYVLNAYARSPFLTALIAIDLDELSGGRLSLAIGAGNRHINEAYQGVRVERPVRKMTEYIELVRRFLSAHAGDRVCYQGEFHTVQDWSPRVAASRRVLPINLAATYPAMRRAAGRVADGIALIPLFSPEYIRDVIRPDVRRAAEDAGRDPDSVRVLGSMWVAVDEDPDRARDAMRRTIVGLFAPPSHSYFEGMLAEQGFGAAAHTVAGLAAEGKEDAALAAVPDELVERLAIAGRPDDCRRRLADYTRVLDDVIVTCPEDPPPGVSTIKQYDSLFDAV
jgi:alkanesulfonate monooxygenase SsuD/methylene tetrahydromethanopterin reductase-like flavin-dependent oxidoreductase (luciferase family)